MTMRLLPIVILSLLQASLSQTVHPPVGEVCDPDIDNPDNKWRVSDCETCFCEPDSAGVGHVLCTVVDCAPLECGEGEIPAHTDGDCCDHCAPAGGFCTEEWAPVCVYAEHADGSHFNETFGNECQAKEFSLAHPDYVIHIIHDGECVDAGACPEIWEPVCVTFMLHGDANRGAETFSNECEAHLFIQHHPELEAEVAHPGECEPHGRDCDPGEEWAENECEHCFCDPSGTAVCHAIMCDWPDCGAGVEPVFTDGACCPSCPPVEECVPGEAIEDVLSNHPCVRCHCSPDGRKICEQIACDWPQCEGGAEPVHVDGECCPVCPPRECVPGEAIETNDPCMDCHCGPDGRTQECAVMVCGVPECEDGAAPIHVPNECCPVCRGTHDLACTLDWNPVCVTFLNLHSDPPTSGMDTFANECEAHRFKYFEEGHFEVTAMTEGECHWGAVCDQEWDPVCVGFWSATGGEGKDTFHNECAAKEFLRSEGVEGEVIHAGECGFCDPDVWEPVCVAFNDAAQDGTVRGQETFHSECEAKRFIENEEWAQGEIIHDGECKDPNACDHEVWEPVCVVFKWADGTTGQDTFHSECEAKRFIEMEMNNEGAEIGYDGECKDPNACDHDVWEPVCVAFNFEDGVRGQETFHSECEAKKFLENEAWAQGEIAHDGECVDPDACSQDYAPVCVKWLSQWSDGRMEIGYDGSSGNEWYLETMYNECEAKRFIEHNPEAEGHVAHDGECEPCANDHAGEPPVCLVFTEWQSATETARYHETFRSICRAEHFVALGLADGTLVEFEFLGGECSIHNGGGEHESCSPPMHLHFGDDNGNNQCIHIREWEYLAETKCADHNGKLGWVEPQSRCNSPTSNTGEEHNFYDTALFSCCKDPAGECADRCPETDGMEFEQVCAWTPVGGEQFTMSRCDAECHELEFDAGACPWDVCTEEWQPVCVHFLHPGSDGDYAEANVAWTETAHNKCAAERAIRDHWPGHKGYIRHEGECEHHPEGQCDPGAGDCGGKASHGDCWCDAECERYGNCCANARDACPASDLWGGQEGEGFNTCFDAAGGVACGGKAPGGCFCDAACAEYGNCCADVVTACPVETAQGETNGLSFHTEPGMCAGSCGGKARHGECWCDAECERYGNCCEGVSDTCPNLHFIDNLHFEGEQPSCAGWCGGHNAPGDCWCDSECERYGNCCADAFDTCPADVFHRRLMPAAAAAVRPWLRAAGQRQ